MGATIVRETFFISGRGVAALLDGDVLPLVPGRLNALLLEADGGATIKAGAIEEWALTANPQWRDRQALLFPSASLSDIPVGARVFMDGDVAS